MRILGKAFVALAAVALMASPSLAQFQRGGGGAGAVLRLLQNKSVQEELKLEKADVEKIPDAVMEALAKVLSKDQLIRLKQIQLQQQGARAFQDAKVQKALKITDDQKKDLKTAYDDANKEIQELFKARDFQAMREKMPKINKELTKKVMGVLTKDQKKAWKAMIGEPFEMKFDRPMGGGGRGGARRQPRNQ